jgi:hypothetical protein
MWLRDIRSLPGFTRDGHVTLTIMAHPRMRLQILRTCKFIIGEKPREARECRSRGSNSRPVAGTLASEPTKRYQLSIYSLRTNIVDILDLGGSTKTMTKWPACPYNSNHCIYKQHWMIKCLCNQCIRMAPQNIHLHAQFSLNKWTIHQNNFLHPLACTIFIKQMNSSPK